MAPINLIYLPLTLGVPDGEKFVDKAFKSIKYSHVQKEARSENKINFCTPYDDDFKLLRGFADGQTDE